MSGHSKWSSIKHKKGAADAKRGQLFSKLSRAIIVAAKEGGPDPAGNLALQNAIEKARSYSMPKDNIERAIAKGSGADADGSSFETVVYEGYGPEGVAVLVEALTDNRNRTASEVRHAFTKHGGNLGTTGAVAWQFERTRRRARGGGRCPTRTSSCWPRPTPAPTTSSSTDRASSSRARPSRCRAVRQALEDGRLRRRVRRARDGPEVDGCGRGRVDGAADRAGSSRGSRRRTTSRTSTRTSTSPRPCSKR